ncbi:hypothetical protein sos41_29400 [Alphaproteobacteria bacterium SO-S41]|nr:hypothetical protein sos41_29400 [Alphaproteobacteria bacterium SO-S41]
MSADDSAHRLVRALVERFPLFAPALAAQLKRDDGVLYPVLFMDGPVPREFMKLVMAGTPAALADAASIARFLEEHWVAGDNAVRDAINTSFLEGLPCSREDQSRLEGLLGQNLAREYVAWNSTLGRPIHARGFQRYVRRNPRRPE